MTLTGLTDAAGSNASPDSAATPVTVDTVAAPTAPVAITAIALDNSGGVVNASEALSRHATVLTVGSGTHRGVLGAGDEVQVSSDGGGQPVDYTLLAADRHQRDQHLELQTITAHVTARVLRPDQAMRVVGTRRATSVPTLGSQTRR